METEIPLNYYLVVAAALFVIGILAVLLRRNAIVMFLGIELMLNAANINFIAFSAFYGDVLGEIFVILAISVAAAEVGVGIAILLNAYKIKKTTDVDELTSMRW